jgi:hypothetical protein
MYTVKGLSLFDRTLNSPRYKSKLNCDERNIHTIQEVKNWTQHYKKKKKSQELDPTLREGILLKAKFIGNWAKWGWSNQQPCEIKKWLA